MKLKKVFAIISFALVMTALLVAIITDFAIFSDMIFTFLGAIIISGVVFIMCLALMLVTIILIFGVVLLNNYGFWPLDVSIKLFKEIIGSINVTSSQMGAFIGVRITLLVMCIIGVVFASIATHRSKEQKEKPPLKALSILAKIFGIMGIIVAISVLIISGVTINS